MSGHPQTFRDAAGCGYTHPSAKGLVLSNAGGRLGWLARRLFPESSTRAYLGYIRLTRARETRRRLKDFMRAPAVPCFTHVEIETLNRCNGDCSFCPVNRRADVRPFLRMDEGLYGRLIEQLAGMGYSGYLGLYSNNEPLLDRRLAGFAAIARAALPQAYLNLSTNGSLLTVDALRELLPSFDRIIVNNYDTRPAMKEGIRRLYHFLRTGEGQLLLRGKTFEISLRHSGDVLTSRAGGAPNRPPPVRPLALPCSLPCSQLIVRPDGKVSLCCNDALGKMTMGDLARQTMMEVWRGDAFTNARQAMHKRGREAIPLCGVCDFVKHDVN